MFTAASYCCAFDGQIAAVIVGCTGCHRVVLMAQLQLVGAGLQWQSLPLFTTVVAACGNLLP